MTTGDSERIARVECRFDADPRLIAGAAAIVGHVARRAGLAEAAASELSAAAQEACNAITRALQRDERSNGRSEIQLAASAFPDHVEATLHPAPDQPTSESARPSEQSQIAAEAIRQLLRNEPVDAVKVEAINGYPAVTLIKASGKTERRFAS